MGRELVVGTHVVNERVFIIAEIGANHEGSLERAFHLIDLAADTGVDAVKFQTYYPEKIVAVTEAQRRQHFGRMALSAEQFQQLAAYCKTKQVMFLSTPFDIESADMLDSLGVPAFKIASGDLTCYPLLKHIARKDKPMIISTGLATLEEIRDMHAYLLKVNPALRHKLAFLHCVSSYPTPLGQANMGMILKLQTEFPEVVIGYSDHSMIPMHCELAAAWGARIIEKHFTDDHQFSQFRDHQLSAEPQELRQLVQHIRAIEHYRDNSKTVSEAEAGNREAFRRSVAARVDLDAGTSLAEAALTVLRPGTGIPAQLFDSVIGRTLKRPIAAGEVLTEAHLV